MGPCTGLRSSELSLDIPSPVYHHGSKDATSGVSNDCCPIIYLAKDKNVPQHLKQNSSHAPLHHFCQCCDPTRRDERRYWRLGTGRAFWAAWRQPAHTEFSAARGFPHWNIASAQRYRWSVWWLPAELWSRWSRPRTERRPERGNISRSKRRNGKGEVSQNNSNKTENVKSWITTVASAIF